MKFKSEQERNEVLARLTLFTLPILIFTNIVFLVAGYFLSQSGNFTLSSHATLMRNVLLGVAMVEMIAIYVVKRSMLSKLAGLSEYTPEVYLQLRIIAIIIAAMCDAIGVYGLVAVILGNKFDVLVFFVAISLIAFQLLRLRARDFEVQINGGI